MVVDAFMFNGEMELLEMRLKMLDPYVDRFIVGEAEVTFSGRAKPLYFVPELVNNPKVEHVVVKNYYSPYILKYMGTLGNLDDISYPHLMAFYQKEHLQAGMQDCKDDDTIYYGDADEIWTPQTLKDEPQKLIQLQYSGYLNQRSSEPWKGTVITNYATVKKFGLNQLREKTEIGLPNGGWHFTNMGGVEEVRRKLQSYDHQEVNTDENHQKLEERLTNGQDFIGRDFSFWVDESEWPQYLKDNREQYKHLCR